MPGVSLSGMMGMATPAGQAGDGVGPAALAIGLGTLVFALGLLWYAWRFTRIAVACRRWEWLPFIGFLTLVIVGLVGLSIPAVAQWGEHRGASYPLPPRLDLRCSQRRPDHRRPKSLGR